MSKPTDIYFTVDLASLDVRIGSNAAYAANVWNGWKADIRAKAGLVGERTSSEAPL